MTSTGQAEMIAPDLLAGPLPRRWAHTRGVAATARAIAPAFGRDADLLVAAAWLHDIGYAPGLAQAGTGFHPVDGARHLRDTGHADELMCRLVAHHSCALAAAADLGLAAAMLAEFPAPPAPLADALTYCDMTTGPDGQAMTIPARLAEITTRYGPGHPSPAPSAHPHPTSPPPPNAPQPGSTPARRGPRYRTPQPYRPLG